VTRVDVGAGFSLAVESSGEGARAFVCLHGLADTRSIWRKLAPGLAERGRVVRVDQRAHGDSSAPPGPYRRDDLAADVRTIVQTLRLGRVTLVGHSMGGIVAMATALAHPEVVDGLVLLGTASEASERVAAWYEKIATAAETSGLDGFRRAVFGADSPRAVAGDATGLAAMTRMLESLHTDPLTPRLPEIACPVRLLVGDKDPMGVGASVIIQRALPNATLEVVPGKGHWLHLEAPDVVLAAIDRRP
jgi:3-oxoadipate enol-lactonase